jgi:drug/metabolite transporter (DMT)-like permease
MPVTFVLLWSTGFIAAKFGLPYAGPMTFLLWRCALVVAQPRFVSRAG